MGDTHRVGFAGEATRWLGIWLDASLNLEENPLAHMTRVATETRSKAMTDWITEHMRPRRRYRPPPGKGVRRTQLRRVKKTLAVRYYQLLSGHAETATHRHRFGRTDTPAC